MSPTTFTLNDNTTIPWLGFGTGTALFNKDSTAFVKTAIESGITHLDGAQIYGNEETLGAGIKASNKARSELFVTTKLFEDKPAGTTADGLLKESLKKLQLEYVDLYLIHSPIRYVERGELKEVWKQMEAAKKAGLAKSIGVSNFKVSDLKLLLEDAEIVPSVNQIEFHPYIWKEAQEIYEFCKNKNITIASYAGLVPITKKPGGPVDATLQSIAARLGKGATPSGVLTKWMLQKGIVVITTSSKASRITETLSFVDLPDLSPDEIQAIETEGSKQVSRIYMVHAFAK